MAVSGWGRQGQGKEPLLCTRFSTRYPSPDSDPFPVPQFSPNRQPLTPNRYSCTSGRADRPRSAAGMGSGFSMRSMMVPDPVTGFGLQHEVRHAIAPRGEARPRVSAADQQGRWSLPGDINSKGAGTGSGGWGRLIDPSCRVHPCIHSSTQPSALDPALDSALYSDRPYLQHPGLPATRSAARAWRSFFVASSGAEAARSSRALRLFAFTMA